MFPHGVVYLVPLIFVFLANFKNRFRSLTRFMSNFFGKTISEAVYCTLRLLLLARELS